MKRLVLWGCLFAFPVMVATAQDAPRTAPSAPAAERSPTADAKPSPPPEAKPAAVSATATPAPPAAATAPTTVPAPTRKAAPSKPSEPAAAPATDKAAAPNPAAGAAPPTSIETDETSPAATKILLPHDLSPWSMFLSADIVVKAVMIGLAFASLMTWTIFFAKSVEFFVARRRLRRGLARLDGKSFAEAKLALGKSDGVLRGFLDVAEHELGLSERRLWDSGAKERCDSELAERARHEVHVMRRGMPFLATIGSTAPFVGLFGTVWGIMNAFIGISKAQTTNLAVVAPGIAEALLATAIGLVAAIPAVVIYNHFSNSGRRYQHLVGKASGTVQRMMSRELDRRLVTTKSAE